MNKFLSFTIVFLLLIGCSKSKNALNESKTTATKKSKNASLISVGSGGGITGDYNGYMISSKGQGYVWTQELRQELEVEPLFNTTSDSVNIWFMRLAAMEIEKVNYNKPGNFSFFIELVKPDTTYKITWSNQNKTPASWGLFYSDFTEYFRTKESIEK
ncbi:MAG: hypothetical protein ACJAZ3_001079 [Sphingobacteriales bacterium]|jgi:hypothetical protein